MIDKHTSPQTMVRKFSYACLIVVLTVLLFDVLVNPYIYPGCSRLCKAIACVAILIMILFSLFRFVPVSVALVVSSYLFTILLYLPFFVGRAAVGIDFQFSFYKLGSCLIILIVTGIVASSRHELILGVINLTCLILSVTFAMRWDIDLQPLNPIIMILFVLVIALFYPFSVYVHTLMDNITDNRQLGNRGDEPADIPPNKQLIACIEEMNSRIACFVMEKTESTQLLHTLTEGMASLNHEKDPAVMKKQLNELKKLCDDYTTLLANSENALWNCDADNQLVASLKVNCSGLTNKELHICSLLEKGMSTKEIALRMHITAETIFDYRKSIRKKLGLNNRRGEKLGDFLQKIKAKL
jgi:DNA-binding CsgD family transcriptional regulator